MPDFRPKDHPAAVPHQASLKRYRGYRVRQPFVVWIKRTGPGNFKAAFRDANIAISGADRDDAYQALVTEILDTFDVLTEESTLIPHAVEQLRVLRKYIVRE